jgi:hypothetical protein
MLSVKTVFLALLASTAIALPIRREVPQGTPPALLSYDAR